MKLYDIPRKTWIRVLGDIKTPPAGPDPTAKTGISLAVSTRIMPPEDATTSNGAVIPASPRLRVRLDR